MDNIAERMNVHVAEQIAAAGNSYSFVSKSAVASKPNRWRDFEAKIKQIFTKAIAESLA
jgi:hypothetical protein